MNRRPKSDIALYILYDKELVLFLRLYLSVSLVIEF